MTLSIEQIFDAKFYLTANPDVAADYEKGVYDDPIEHFINYGEAEGRAPSALFDPLFYATTYPEVAAAFARGEYTSVLQHFLLYGEAEGRIPSRFFNPNFYALLNPDVTLAVQQGVYESVFAHYALFGKKEGRAPNSLFDPFYYASQNKDVAEAVEQGVYESVLDHFALYGINENRPTSPFTDLAFYRFAYGNQIAQYYGASSVFEVSFEQTFNHLLFVGLPQGFNPSQFVDFNYYRNTYSSQLTRFYQVASVEQISFSQTYQYMISQGLVQGQNPSPFVDLNFYRTAYATQLTNYYQVESINQLDFSQIYRYAVTQGLDEGLNTSGLVDFDYYRTAYAAALTSYFNVSSVSQISIEQTYTYLVTVGLDQGFNPSEFVDLQFFRQTYTSQLTNYYQVSSIEQVSLSQTFEYLSSVGLQQGLNTSALIDVNYYRETYAAELINYYQVKSINQISLTQTYNYMISAGLEKGFNTSQFVDFGFYRQNYAAELTRFYGVSSITEVSFEQTYRYMVSVGLQRGFKTSALADFDYYRSNFAQEIIQFYGVSSITQVTVKQILQFIISTTKNQQGNGEISGLKWNDLNGNGEQDGELITGTQPDVVFVLDVSGSTTAQFKGTPVGDVNQDKKSNRILDAEIAGFSRLNQELIDLGYGDSAEVGIVVFGTRAAQLDMDSKTSGVQLTIQPNADENNNGIPDVQDILNSIKVGSSGVGKATNYKEALKSAKKTIDTLGSTGENGNIIFLSDGEHNGDPFRNEVEALKDSQVNVRAFGVGSSASLIDLKTIDQGAEIFTTSDELLGIFSNLKQNNTSTNNSNNAGLEPGLGGITIYLDLNQNGKLDAGEPETVTDNDGKYRFTGLPAGRYTVREVVENNTTQTYPTSKSHTVQLGLGEKVKDRNFGNTVQQIGGSVTGTLWQDFNSNGKQDKGLIAGNPPDAVYVIDVSSSSLEKFDGTAVGDVNGDGKANTILDGQLAGFIALNKTLIQQGLGQTANVGISVFAKTGQTVDMNTATTGVQVTTKAGADSNGDGISDVEELLKKIGVEAFGVQAGTRFEAGLQAAETTLETLGTDPGNGNIIFISDGEDDSNDYLDEVTGLRSSNFTLRAFGAGNSASLTSLKKIDPEAQVFTTTDELLGVFSGGSGAGGSQNTVAEPGLANATVYLDLNNNGVLDADEPKAITNEQGRYELTNIVAGTYQLRQSLPTGFSQTTFPNNEFYTLNIRTGQTLENYDFGALPVG
jgi:hypothetical protein